MPNMIRILVNYLAILVPLLIIDFAWLVGVARSFYKQQLGYLMTDQVNWLAALLFYSIYAGAIYYFVITLEHNLSFSQVALRGALFGLVAYATYDLTNLATVKQWPVLITVVDMAWGALLTAAVAVTANWLIQLWK